MHDHKKTCVAAKILENLHFIYLFIYLFFLGGGSSLHFDKEKWY